MTHFSYPTWELAEDISSLFSLLSTNDHTGVDWVGKPDIKNNDDDDAAMDNINQSESVSCAEKESVDDNLADKEAEELQEAWKERTELMADQGKPRFTNI